MTSRRTFLAGIASASALGLAHLAPPAALASSPVPVIAAASSLRHALPDLAARFRELHGHSVRLSFSSSGNLARQVRQGAPYELFLSADAAFIRDLAEAGLVEGRAKTYALGTLVLYAPENSPLEVSSGLAGLSAQIGDGLLKRLAIANPEHAPYGRAARQALEKADLWDRLKDQIVLGENVSQAAQFAVSGSCEAALIARSLAVSPGLRSAGRYARVTDELYDPLRQDMALLRGAGPVARLFFAFLGTPDAGAILLRHGLDAPSGKA